MKKTSFYSLLVVLFLFSTDTYAIDLVAFGKACLQQEKTLQFEEQRLTDKKARMLTEQRRRYSKIIRSDYSKALNQLKSDLQICKKTTPSSNHCHKIRIQYVELEKKISQSREEANDNWDLLSDFYNNPYIDNDIYSDQDNYLDHYQRFEQICRDSDTHYELINNPEAYHIVCGSNKTRHSLTCSFVN